MGREEEEGGVQKTKRKSCTAEEESQFEAGMSGSKLQVRLYRDSFNTPWGFRLQGGKDLGQPLSIQRVSSVFP